MFLKQIKLHYLGLVILLVISSTLRFVDLGYSEFQDDEKKTQIRLYEGETWLDFFMRQRKGPMQFLVAQVPFSIYNPKVEVNELAVRLPFTLANLVSVFVLYALIYKLTKSHTASLITSTVYSVNGFVVGFSRIAQYQNLNLLFSLLSLYFFAVLNSTPNKLKTYTFLATLFTALSILSHWDAVFYIIPMLYFIIGFALRKDISQKDKLRCSVVSFITFCTVVLPFMIPYLLSLVSNQTGNVDYLFKRIGTTGAPFVRHKYIFELYNPEIALWLYLVGLVLGGLFIKKTYFLVLWFGFNLIIIKFFMITPKTHIYNYVIPALVVASLSLYYLLCWLISRTKLLGLVATSFLSVTVCMLFIQSYQIFVDHEKEYPFDEKKVLWHLNPVLKDEEIITFGFPHNRGWKKIDKVIDSKCRYITNESKGISQVYVKAQYGVNEGCSYIVVIKRPFYTMAQNAIYAEAKKSKLVYTFVKNDEALSKVYKIR